MKSNKVKVLMNSKEYLCEQIGTFLIPDEPSDIIFEQISDSILKVRVSDNKKLSLSDFRKVPIREIQKIIKFHFNYAYVFKISQEYKDKFVVERM